ncbi:phosphoenolpyruvate synthase [Candidatus Woesearchaeota archaeon]|nr:phosphoenolpyruvate synthase [Candidatus Woesearchaeota archaeon]
MVKSKSRKFILWFNQLGIEDVKYVGGKNASLGEMYRNLIRKGIAVPNGFAVTAYAYKHFLKKAKLEKSMRTALRGLDTHNMKDLQERGKAVRKIILDAELPNDLKKEICKAYHKLCKEYGENTDTAVRSSATAEDLPDASFAGQQESYLNVRGEEELILACKKCIASLFTDRAISYRVDKKFDHFRVYLSIGVQKMVRSDKACSGVMFTLDTESGFRNVVFINGSWGLGENIVQGAVNPDEFYVFKPTLAEKYNAIITKKLGDKKMTMIYGKSQAKKTINKKTPENLQNKYVLTDKEVLQLAQWGVLIEQHYSKKAKHWKPMDIEWAKDGVSGKLFIVQARPETIHSQKNLNVIKHYQLQQKGKIIATGRSVGSKIGKGTAHIIRHPKDIKQFRKGEVLITEMTDPDWEPIMKIASAIVTEKGGRTSHAAIVSRELGIPCVVGCENAMRNIKQGQKVTVSAAQGEEGYVYDGLLKFIVKEIDVSKMRQPKTHVMMNVGDPEQAFELSFLPNDGVGLAREEFIITSFIKVHPLALLHYDQIKDRKIKARIEKLTKGYKDKKQFFVDRLAYGIGTIAAAFYPKQVILRTSDFKSNEYASLIGGKQFEPLEANPMIGWRGASRYYHPRYQEAFGLECAALKKAREEMGLTNIIVMIPFCRTVDEGKKVIETMKKYGLVRGKNGLKVYAMCEIPSNVLLAEEFLDVFDGFSIGSNDLTQLTLGLDRDSELVSSLYNERNPAVEKLIENVIKVANKKKKYIGLCGQAPSDYPDFAKFLVRSGIKSMSINPDSMVKARFAVNEIEKRMRR